MAKNKTPKNVNTNTNTGATFFDSQVPLDQVISSLPESFKQSGLPQDENGVVRYLMDGGATVQQILDWRTSDTGVADALAWASSDQFKHPAAKPQAADPAAQGEKKSKKRPFKPMAAEEAGALMEKVSRGGTGGGKSGGDTKRVEFRQTPESVEIVTRYRRGGAPAEGAPVVAEEAATPSKKSKKSSKSQPQDEPMQPISLREQIAKAKQDYVTKSKGMPAPWYVGPMAVAKRYGPGTLAALGSSGVAGLTAYGLSRLFGDSTPAQPAAGSGMSEEEKERIRERRNQLLRPRLPSPQPAAPQANPAGMPPDTNTTLMQRLMASREYV